MNSTNNLLALTSEAKSSEKNSENGKPISVKSGKKQKKSKKKKAKSIYEEDDSNLDEENIEVCE